jgi:aspartyl-tRNA(Asn)/glutamyl-tRNA(Gln) amidotransferase subunit A
MSVELRRATAAQLRDGYLRGAFTPSEVVDALLAAIAKEDATLGAWLSLRTAEVRAEAERAGAAYGAARANGDRAMRALPPLLGVPVALKDLVNMIGTPTTAGSKILDGYISPYDATIAAKLKDAGALILGKTNMDEFAMGSSTEFSAYKRTVNPWDLERVPGGSSGGSASAVAALHAPLSIGSDTGGSIRQPASLTGITGVKPTYGRVSRYGIVAFASSLDQIGPFARSAQDAALLLHAIAGADPRDATSAAVPVDDALLSLPNGDRAAEAIKGKRLALPKEYFVAGMEAGSSRQSVPPSPCSSRRARSSKGSAYRQQSMRWPPTTSLPPPRPQRTWRAMTGSATAHRGTVAARCSMATSRRGVAGSARRSADGSCSAPTRSRPATTTRTT